MSRNNFYQGGVIKRIFLQGYELVPNTNQLWEIDMAYGEIETLASKEKMIERSAFFCTHWR